MTKKADLSDSQTEEIKTVTNTQVVPAVSTQTKVNTKTTVPAPVTSKVETTKSVADSAKGITTSVPLVEGSKVTITGNWNGRAQVTSGGFCQDYQLTAVVEDGVLLGVYKGEIIGDIGKFQSTVTSEGVITPGAADYAQNPAQFKGKIVGSNATGTWKYDQSGVYCAGTFSMTKQ
jgi:hypothetical protein